MYEVMKGSPSKPVIKGDLPVDDPDEKENDNMDDLIVRRKSEK